MIIKRATFEQATSSSLWDVHLPAGGLKGRPLAVYDLNGNSHEFDSWSFENGHLLVSFGVDPVAGSLEYEYQIEGEEEPITLSTNGGTINVYQYNNAPSSQG